MAAESSTKLELFKGHGSILDRDGKPYSVVSIDPFEDGLACTACLRCKNDGWSGPNGFVCSTCVIVRYGALSPCFLMNRFSRTLWDGDKWVTSKDQAKVFSTTAACEAERDNRFGGSAILSVVLWCQVDAVMAEWSPDEFN